MNEKQIEDAIEEAYWDGYRAGFGDATNDEPNAADEFQEIDTKFNVKSS